MTGCWIKDNTDVIIFLHGIVMLLMAGILYRPGRGFRSTNPEFNLQVFAIGICLIQWINIFLYLFPGMDFLYLPCIVLFSVSFTALFFYSLSVHHAWMRRVVLIYVLAAAGAAIMISVKSGYNTGCSSVYFTLAFPSSLGVSFTLFRFSIKPVNANKAGWLIAALSFFLYSVSWLISPPPDFSILSRINDPDSRLYFSYASLYSTASAAGILTGFYVLKSYDKTGKRYFQERYLFPLLMLSVIIISIYSVSWRGRIAGEEIKHETLRHARGVANAINPEVVTRLSFSPSDYSNPVFKLIRNQMVSYGIHSGIKSIYSFTMINGRIVFGPENIDAGDPMSSPPGTVYIQPHPDFRRAFSDALPGVVGPYRDEYGTFISGYAPVIDPRSGSVMMVAAIDYPADRWQFEVSSARLSVFIITFIILFVIMMMNTLLVVRRVVWADSVSFAARQLETFFIIGSGLLLSIIILLILSDSERRRVLNNFFPVADSVAGIIRDNLFNINYDLDSLSEFFKSSKFVSEEEFSRFISDLRYSSVKSRGWYPVKGGIDDHKTELRILYEVPPADKKKAGYRLSSTPEGKAAVNNSIVTGMASFLEYPDVKEGGDKLMTAILPVYGLNGSIRGFLSSTSDIDLVLNYSMSFSRSRNLHLETEITDITSTDEDVRLAGCTDSMAGCKDDSYYPLKNAVYPVFIFDRVLGIKIRPGRDYYRNHTSNTGALAGILTLILTIAVSILSGYLRGKEYTLEDQIAARTKDLSESEERFRALHEASFGGISIHHKGKILECNEGLTRMTGYPVDELTGMDGLLLIEPAWREFVMEKILSGYEKSYDVEGIRKDGSVFPLEIHGKNIPYHGINVRVTEFRDITERKRSEQLLKRQREELEAANEQLQAEMEVFESMNSELIEMNQKLVESEEKFSKAFGINPSIMMISSLDDGRIFEVNSAFLQTFGYEREEIAGKTIFDLDLFMDAGQRDLALDFIRRDGLVRNLEVEIKTSRGERRYGLFSADYITIHNEKYMLTVMTDITERKQTELRLSHMQKMDAIGQLAGGVAHDFNNHLGGILGYAELLSMKLKDETLKKYADNIISVAIRSADLIKKLLAFARKGQFQQVNVNIHDILDETIEILHHSIDRRITIIKKYNSEDAIVPGDPAQLQNVFLNIGLNARDAMPEGGTMIFETGEIFFSGDTRKVQILDILEGDYIFINVNDTGIGMTEDVKSHLFEPFFTTKESGKGTGMGLASVYGAVKNHNGSVSVYSEPGEGTTFRIYLPVLKGYTEKSGKTVSEKVPDIPPQRILVIDDEDSLRSALSEALTGMGHSVFESADGTSGVALYREMWRDIDLVIIDMIMPEMNGRDAFLEMKKINPGIKAILSSGFSMNGESQLMQAEGISGYIQKPYRKNELIKKINEILG